MLSNKNKLPKNINEEWAWNHWNYCKKLKRSYSNVNAKIFHKKHSNSIYNFTVQNKTQSKKSINF